MKVWRKNLVAAAVLVTVCAGIYANWVYTEKNAVESLSDTLDYDLLMQEEAAMASAENLSTTAEDYFAAVRLSRQQARDNAIHLLQDAMVSVETANTGTGSKTTESSVELEDIVQTALSEARIESLIIAKGYQDCVAYMTPEGISVAVAAPEGGLQQEDVAVIADVVMAQSDYGMNSIRVVEVQ